VKSIGFLIIKGLAFSNDWLSLREIIINFCSFSKLAFIANSLFLSGGIISVHLERADMCVLLLFFRVLL